MVAVKLGVATLVDVYVNEGVAVLVCVTVDVLVLVCVALGLAVRTGVTAVAVAVTATQFSANAFIAIVGLPVLSNAPLLYPCQPL